jgi:hypothetical protein
MKKFLKTVLLTVFVSMLFVVPVAAASGTFNFRLEIADDADSVQFSSNVRKTDNDNYARVTYTNSNIGNSDNVQFTIVGQQHEDDLIYSESVQATANTGTYYLYYTVRPAYNDNMYRLKGETFRYYVLVSGDWAP